MSGYSRDNSVSPRNGYSPQRTPTCSNCSNNSISSSSGLPTKSELVETSSFYSSSSCNGCGVAATPFCPTSHAPEIFSRTTSKLYFLKLSASELLLKADSVNKYISIKLVLPKIILFL